MKAKLLMAAVLVSGLSTQVSADELSLEGYVSALVSNTIDATLEEMHYDVEAAVLTAGNLFSLNAEENVQGKVSITDVDNQETEKQSEE